MTNSGNNLDEYLSGTGQILYNQAKDIIPGGTQLLSKNPEMFASDICPAYYSKAKGCKVWDMDDNDPKKLLSTPVAHTAFARLTQNNGKQHQF